MQAQVLQERGLLDQAEALLPDLVTSGDDDTVKCAKKQRAQLIALRAKARDPRGVAERLGAQSTGSVVPVLLGAAVGLLVAFLLWRLARIAFPPSPTTLRTHRQWAGWYAGAGLVVAAGAVGALLSAYLHDSWPAPLTLNRNWWLFGLLAVLVAAHATLTPMNAGKGSLAVALQWAAWSWILVAAFAGFMAAAAWGWARQWFGVAAAVAATILLGLWAGSKLRLSFGEFKGGTDVPAGFAAAVAAELVALGEEAPRGVFMVAGTDETQLPTDKLGALPGGKWAAALVSVWRAATPSSDLIVTGGFLAKEGGEQRVAVSLRRGRRVESSATIESRSFAVADGTASAAQPPSNDAAKAAQPTAERAAVWHDLATGTAAWLLFELKTLTGDDKTRLAGAKHWQSIAFNAVATHRRDEGHDKAALELLLRAVNEDPGNLAAQYGRLALEALQINGLDKDAERRYQGAYQALQALPIDEYARMPLGWRRAYMSNALLSNMAKVSSDKAKALGEGNGRRDAETADQNYAEKAAIGLGELIDRLRPVTEEKYQALKDYLLSLSRPACLGVAVLPQARSDVVEDAVRKATTCTRGDLKELKTQPTTTDIKNHALAWLDPKQLDLLAPRPAYNAACARTALENVHIGENEQPPEKLETLLRRAFQQQPLAKYAEQDPFLQVLQQEWWYKDLRADADVDMEPTGLAAFMAVNGHEKALEGVGIKTLKELHDRLHEEGEPQTLAKELRLPVEQLLRWRALLDVWALNIPIRWINILQVIGVDSVTSLSGQ